MAKFGEGDPRWIVQHREDGHNVNAWHWTELDRTKWSKSFFEEHLILSHDEVDEGGWKYSVKVTKVKSCNVGEAVVRNRKGKKVGGFEFSLKLDWEGRVFTDDLEDDKGDIGNYKGTIEVPEFADDTAEDEIEVLVKCKAPREDVHEKLKAIADKHLVSNVRSVLAKFKSDLLDCVVR